MSKYWDGEDYKNNSRLQRTFGSMIIDKFIVNDRYMLGLNEKIGLDIGCGDGFITNELQQKLKCKVNGIDFSPDMIVVAKEYEKQNKNVSFSQRDITESMESMDCEQKYSFVTSFFCLQWLTDQKAAYHNISELLSTGGYGYLLISPKKKTNTTNYVSVIQELLKGDEYSKYFSDFCIERFDLTRENIESNIKKSGLVLDKIIEINEPFFFVNRKELSNFFGSTVSNRLVIRIGYESTKKEHVEKLCDNVVKQIVNQHNFIEMDNGQIKSQQTLLFVILHK